MGEKDEKVSLMIRTHVSRVAPDWDLSDTTDRPIEPQLIAYIERHDLLSELSSF